MVQDQLVEYISSQMKLGVSRDAIKSALVGAGWVAVDVEDTLKKVEGTGTAKPATPSASPKTTSSPMGGSQSIRVSDLVSSSTTAGVTTASVAMAGKNNNVVKTQTQPQVQSVKPAMKPVMTSSSSFSGNEFPPKQKRPIMMIIAVVFLVVFAGLSGFLYFQNSGLATKIASLSTQSATVTANIASLNTQVQNLDATNTALTAQVNSLMAINADLILNLSFAVVPPASMNEASGTVSISGTLTAGKSSFILTTQYGVVVMVQNAKAANVVAALTPLLNSSSSVTLTGTHIPGSQYLTVTGVNGASL
jgi:cell division protein FtsB